MSLQRESPLYALRAHLGQKIAALQSAYLNARTSSSLQILAALRRAPMESPGTDPELWGLTLSELPESLQAHGDAPSRAELSIHAALILYAVHQQSSGSAMHERSVGMGAAVARLANARGHGGEPDKSVIVKFHRICSAQHRSSRLRELRSLMSLLRSSSIPLDHAQLGVDLFLMDSNASRDQVVLRWGRDLHRRPASFPKLSATTSDSSSTTEKESA